MDILCWIKSSLAFLFGFASILWTWFDMRSQVISGFATKTAYRHCGLQPFRDGSHDSIDKHCDLVHINALFRHGTRSPSKKDVANFKDLHKRLTNSLDAKLPNGFTEHPIPFQDRGDKQLLPMGYEELYTLGKHYRRRAKSAFNLELSNIRFLSSSSERALNSGRSFFHGFFNQPRLRTTQSKLTCDSAFSCKKVGTEPIEIADHMLRFFDYCERYRKDVEKNKSTLVEVSQFLHGAEMKKVFNYVMLKHNLNAANFTISDMYTLYVACAFETAANPDTVPLSPWCHFFRPEHFSVLEYFVDLKQYWLRSYGYELNYLQSCPLVGEMLAQLRNAAKQYLSSLSNNSVSDIHRATFWFGHAETLLPVVAALGLFNDSVGHHDLQRLSSANFYQWLEKSHKNPVPPTMFRSGYIAPFAGNIALHLYYCPNRITNHHEDPFDGFYIRPEVNGQTVAWPVASPVQPPTIERPGGNSAPLTVVLSQFDGCMPGVYDDDKVCKLGKHSS